MGFLKKWWTGKDDQDEVVEENTSESEASQQAEECNEQKDEAEKRKIKDAEMEQKEIKLFLYIDDNGVEREVDLTNLKELKVHEYHDHINKSTYSYVYPYPHLNQWEYLTDIDVAYPQPKHSRRKKSVHFAQETSEDLASKIMEQGKELENRNSTSKLEVPTSTLTSLSCQRRAPTKQVNLPSDNNISPQKAPTQQGSSSSDNKTSRLNAVTSEIPRVAKPTITFSVPPPPPILSEEDERVFMEDVTMKVAQYKTELRAWMKEVISEGVLIPVGKNPLISPYWPEKALAYVALYAYSQRSQEGVPIAPDAEESFACSGSRSCIVADELTPFKPLPVPGHMATQSMFARCQVKNKKSTERRCHVCVGIGHLHDWIAYELNKKLPMVQATAPGNPVSGIDWEDLERNYIVPLKLARPTSLVGASSPVSQPTSLDNKDHLIQPILSSPPLNPNSSAFVPKQIFASNGLFIPTKQTLTVDCLPSMAAGEKLLPKASPSKSWKYGGKGSQDHASSSWKPASSWEEEKSSSSWQEPVTQDSNWKTQDSNWKSGNGNWSGSYGNSGNWSKGWNKKGKGKKTK